MSVLYVAEIGSQHKGNISLACEYARAFKEAGADILKMQFGHDPKDPVRHVSVDMAEMVAAYCASIGLQYMASLFSLEGLWLAQHVNMRAYKLAHQRSDDWPFVESVLADEKQTFVSFTHKPDWHTLKGAFPIFCTDTYPTMPWDLTMPAEFDWQPAYPSWYGYSDHTHGIGACLLAVARGAQYIEKHVCLDKTDLWTKDTSFSATPAEFAELVRLGKQIEQVRDAAA